MQLPPRTLVVATDFSDASSTALDAAEFFGRAHGTTVVLAHCFDPSPFVAPAVIPGPSSLMEQAARDMKAQVVKSLEELRAERFGDADVVIEVLRHSSPGEALVEHAKTVGAELIIVGSHGRTGLRRVLLGSVAERVVRLAPCPVLVVPSPSE